MGTASDEPVLSYRCPESRSQLRAATSGELTALNDAINAGRMQNRAGEAVTEPIEGAYVRTEGDWAYPVRRGIPMLLIDEALPIS